MDSSLLRQSLSDLRDRFESLRGKGKLRAVLFESPILEQQPAAAQPEPPFSKEESVWTWSQTYRTPVPRTDSSGKLVVADTPFFNAAGAPELDAEGKAIDFENCGANWVVQLYGDDTIWEQFKDVATAAGRLLESVQPPIQGRFPHETLGLTEAPLRWICAIFDLAWAKMPGSPLRADKSVRVEIDPDVVDPNTVAGDLSADDFLPEKESGQGSAADKKKRSSSKSISHDSRRSSRPEPLPWHRTFALAVWPHVVREHSWKEAFRGITDPPQWFSTLDDLVQASIYALDILVNNIVPPGGEADNNKPKGPPADPWSNETREGDCGKVSIDNSTSGGRGEGSQKITTNTRMLDILPKNSDAGVTATDGPWPPTSFLWKGAVAYLAPIPFQLVNFLWSVPSRTAKVDDVFDNVWGKESGRTESSLKSAISRANQTFSEKDIPIELNQKSGYVVLRILPE